MALNRASAARQREEWLATLSSNTIGVAFPFPGFLQSPYSIAKLVQDLSSGR
jgi:hypothetical protein